VAITQRDKTGSGLITDTKALPEYDPNTSIHLSDYALCRALMSGVELTAFGHCTKASDTGPQIMEYTCGPCGLMSNHAARNNALSI
jgi:hypothetical protein